VTTHFNAQRDAGPNDEEHDQQPDPIRPSVARPSSSVALGGKSVKGLQHWLQSDPPFANNQDKQNAQRTADEALRYYEHL
jgi:hypothetical protein